MERARFFDVDYTGNRNLLAEARRAGVARYICVSVAGAGALPGTRYVQAHERFVAELAEAGIPFTVIRPTGCFSAVAALLPWARAGIVPLVRPGLAYTNPIHEAEVAQACVDALQRPDESRIIGGPEIFTRHRLAEMVFDAIGRPPRLLRLDPPVVRAAALLSRPLQPRLSALLEFGLYAAQTDIVAPRYGTLRLGDYLRALTAVAESAR